MPPGLAALGRVARRSPDCPVPLRHTGQTLAASTGATLADLKKRLGHSSAAAALRYLHAVEGRDKELAGELSKLAARGTAIKLPKTITGKH